MFLCTFKFTAKLSSKCIHVCPWSPHLHNLPSSVFYICICYWWWTYLNTESSFNNNNAHWDLLLMHFLWNLANILGHVHHHRTTHKSFPLLEKPFLLVMLAFPPTLSNYGCFHCFIVVCFQDYCLAVIMKSVAFPNQNSSISNIHMPFCHVISKLNSWLI